MGVFKDRTGRDWHVDVNVSALHRARTGELKLDLLDHDSFSRLDDPEILVGVLYEICRPEIERRGVTAEQFSEALSAGDVFNAATMALLESLANFDPNHRRRAMGTAAVQAMTLMDNLGLVATVEQLLATHGPSSTDSPASSVATQAT